MVRRVGQVLTRLSRLATRLLRSPEALPGNLDMMHHHADGTVHAHPRGATLHTHDPKDGSPTAFEGRAPFGSPPPTPPVPPAPQPPSSHVSSPAPPPPPHAASLAPAPRLPLAPGIIHFGATNPLPGAPAWSPSGGRAQAPLRSSACGDWASRGSWQGGVRAVPAARGRGGIDWGTRRRPGRRPPRVSNLPPAVAPRRGAGALPRILGPRPALGTSG